MRNNKLVKNNSRKAKNQFFRLRRLRKNPSIRDMSGALDLTGTELIQPYFVTEAKSGRSPIKAMPGVYRFSIKAMLEDIAAVKNMPAVLLFGLPDKKNRSGSSAYKKNGVVQRAVAAIKKEFPDLPVFTDVCLCSYTSHGHCGLIGKGSSPDNDRTVQALVKIALSHARAGADFVCPSAMMDGQVFAIRSAIDREGFQDTGIMSYSAKYASNFYGPFREAAKCAPSFGDRKAYQLDFRDWRQAMRKIEADIQEGADIIMVKPALAYLDIICRARSEFNLPIAAYNVSAEYSMVKSYVAGMDKRIRPEAEKAMVLEMLTAIKRAGADIIISYWARSALSWLKQPYF